MILTLPMKYIFVYKKWIWAECGYSVRLDRIPLQMDDMIVGVLYGERISANYKTIATTYPVYCGVEFWEHITGDKIFYYQLAKAFGEVVEEDEIDGSALIMQKVEDIAKEITEKGNL